MKDTKIPAGYREAAAELLYAIPITSHPQFIRYPLFLHLCLNGKEARTEDFYGEDPEDAAKRGNRALGSTGISFGRKDSEYTASPRQKSDPPQQFLADAPLQGRAWNERRGLYHEM